MSLTIVTLILNRIVSTPNPHFMTIDIKKLYLVNTMAQSEYMGLKLSDLHKSVVQQYNLEAKETRDGYVHMDI